MGRTGSSPESREPEELKTSEDPDPESERKKIREQLETDVNKRRLIATA